MNYFNKVSEFSQIDFYFWFSFVFLILILFFQFLKISEEKKVKIYLYLFFGIIFFYLGYSLLLIFLQYQVWKNHPLSRYLLPPYQEIYYFLSYSFFHYLRDFYFRLVGTLVSIGIFFFISFILKRDPFYEEEKILVLLLSLFFSFPYNFLFIILGFFVLLLIIMLKIVLNKGSFFEYYSLKNYWLFLALIFFLLQPIFLTNYQFLKFKP